MTAEAASATLDAADWQDRWDALVAGCPDPFLEVDGMGVATQWNPSAEQSFGWRRAEIVGRPVSDTILPAGVGGTPFVGPDWRRARDRDRDVRTRFVVLHRSGEPVPVDGLVVGGDHEAGGAVGGFLKPVAATGAARRGRDPLTGLLDRPAFCRMLQQVPGMAGGVAGSVAVVLLDLDRFKAVNNSMGHDAGDRLLVAAAGRLTRVSEGTEAVARFGGDEFLVLVVRPGGDALPAAQVLVERAQAALAAPFVIHDRELFVEVSFGIALNTFGVDDAAELLANAESAMYQAKSRGGAAVATFGESMRIEALDRMATEHSLHRALERSELTLHYQPVVEIDGVTTIGVEALVRWHHPQQGMVAPVRFIAVAEESGLIIPIGAWVLEQACRQLHEWHSGEPAGPRGSIEVNLSARQVDDPLLVATVSEILSRTGLPPELLTLEITESALMKDAVASLDVLRALKELGVLLAIDDFGTGYSSLSYLQRFPLDILKVDRSFVETLGTSSGGEAIVAAVIELGHALGLQVVAEGVETPEQLEVLRSLSCDLAQGYLFSRPLPAAELDAAFGVAVGA